MGDNPTYNSISTNQISTAAITASTIYARTSISTVNVYADYLKGDGSALSNLSYSGFATTIPRTSYAPYSIPWNAMEDEGSINLRSGTWSIDGKFTATIMSVPKLLEASTITVTNVRAVNARIASLTSPVICSFLISTDTLRTTNVYFKEQNGGVLFVNSTISKYISTESITANNLNISKFVAQLGTFSTISTGLWEVDTIKSDRLQLLDFSSLAYGFVSLSANTLYLNSSSILSNVVLIEELVSTSRNLIQRITVASNFLFPHNSLSSLDLAVRTNFITSQIALSTLSIGIGNIGSETTTSISNLSVNVNGGIINLSNYTITTTSNISTTITNRIIENETQSLIQFNTLSNYVNAQDTILRVGISSASYHIELNTSNHISNTSTSIGQSVSSLRTGLSSVGFIMASGLSSVYSTISTQSGWNLSTVNRSISTSISNLSVSVANNFSEVRQGISTNGSNISLVFGSVFSSLSSSGLFQSVSSFSTVVGDELKIMSNVLASQNNNVYIYINANVGFVSTLTGSNLSTLQRSVSSLSTLIDNNFISLSTFTGSNTSTLTQNQLSTISTFSTSIQLNFINLSTIIGSNTSTLRENHLSTISTFSTNIGSIESTLTSYDFSKLLLGLSSLSTSINSNFSVTLFYISSVSTNFNTFSNISLLSFSTLSTTIGSTTSTLYSVLALGISSLSTFMAEEKSSSRLSTLQIFVSSISSANLTSKVIFTSTFVTSTLSTGVGFFGVFQGSTMSSLTQQIGQLQTSQIIASSFSGNLNDTTTVVIQNI
jgi:hypothetical protein